MKECGANVSFIDPFNFKATKMSRAMLSTKLTMMSGCKNVNIEFEVQFYVKCSKLSWRCAVGSLHLYEGTMTHINEVPYMRCQ